MYMAVIKPYYGQNTWSNITWICVASYSIIMPISVSSFLRGIARFVSHDYMVSVRSIQIQENNFWVVRKGGQSNNRVSIGNRDGIWKRIRGIEGYFVQSETITNRHGSDNQIWTITINQKGVVEAFKNCPVIILSQWNFLVTWLRPWHNRQICFALWEGTLPCG